jgi:transcriptional regulator with XRE-family HTH domain
VEPLYTALGELVRGARVEAGLTQEELGKGIDRTRTSVANIEAGRQRILLHTLYAIARMVEKSPGELLPDPAALEIASGLPPQVGDQAPDVQRWIHVIADAPDDTEEPPT